MCVSPSFVYSPYGPEGNRVPVPCKLCWRCRSNRLNDYVGRALAESACSDWTLSLTLTYADTADGMAERVLTPRHFQDFVRSMRKRGHRIRYIGVGEYGSRKGRAHFHCILFGKGEPPDIPQKRNAHIPAWPWGHVFGDWSADHRALRYVCKYILKWEGTDSWFTLSKKPSLGAEWFAQKAQQHIEAGTLPSSFEYMPPGGVRGKRYLVTGATRRDFINAIFKGWLEHRPLDTSRLSPWISVALDKEDRRKHRAFIDALSASEQWASLLWTINGKRLSARQVIDAWFRDQRLKQAAEDARAEKDCRTPENVFDDFPEGYRALLKGERSWLDVVQDQEADLYVGDSPEAGCPSRILDATLSALLTRDAEQRERSKPTFQFTTMAGRSPPARVR